MITQFIRGKNESPRKSRPKMSGFRAGVLSASALLLTLGASFAGAQQIISVDFQGGANSVVTPMAPTEVAGFVPVANWNNAPTKTGTLATVTDSTGATATGVSVTWNAPAGTWGNGLPDVAGDSRLLKGYLDTGANGSAPTTVTVSGLTAANTYSIYVYSTGDSGGRSGKYSVGGQTFYLAELAGDLTYQQSTSADPANPGTGNYTVFTVSNTATFTLSATPDSVAGGGFRAPVNGIQIVQVLQPPAAPTGLAATAADSSVSLTWNAVSGAATYNVLRGAKTGGPYTTIATGVTNPTYTDSGLTNGTTYFYVVQAVNKNGTSANSNEASVTPLASVPGNGTISINFVGGNGTILPTPLAPTDTAGYFPAMGWNNETGPTGTAATLTDSAGGATSALVTWAGSPNTWAAGIGDTTPDNRLMEGYLDTSNTSTTSVTVSGLDPKKTYIIYEYSAGDAGGHSGIYSVSSAAAPSYAMITSAFGGTYIQGTATDPANPTAGNFVTFQVTGQASYTVSATPDATAGGGFRAPLNGVQFVVVTPPAAPTNLTAVGLDSSVYLSWNAVPLVTSYNVLRRVGTTGAFTTIGTATGTSYTDATAVNGTTYSYVVQAVNAAATSANSNIATATPIKAIVGTGNGLSGAYYNGAAVDFSAQTTGTLVFSDIVPVINFNAGNAYTTYNPTAWPAGVPSTNFTAVWTGQVLAPYTGSYQFQTITDDGARLSVDGTVLFTDMTGHAPTANTSAAITLTAGTEHTIKFEYYQGGGGYTAQLLYSTLGAPFQIIPQSQLSTTFTTAPGAPTNLTAAGHNHSVQLAWNAGLNSAFLHGQAAA